MRLPKLNRKSNFKIDLCVPWSYPCFYFWYLVSLPYYSSSFYLVIYSYISFIKYSFFNRLNSHLNLDFFYFFFINIYQTLNVVNLFFIVSASLFLFLYKTKHISFFFFSFVLFPTVDLPNCIIERDEGLTICKICIIW